MPQYNLNFSRLENLITQYVNSNGFDNKASKLFEITERLRSSESYKLTEIIILAGMLNVSADYLVGSSDDPEADGDDIVKILSNSACLNSDYRKSLLLKSDQYLNMQDNLIDFDKAGITVKHYFSDGKIKDELDIKSNISMVADNKENLYTNNDKE